MFHLIYSVYPNYHKNQYHENLMSLSVLCLPICYSNIFTFYDYSLGDPLRVGSSCFAQSFLHLHEEIEAFLLILCFPFTVMLQFFMKTGGDLCLTASAPIACLPLRGFATGSINSV